MKDFAEPGVISRAHDWRGPAIPGGNNLVCIRCGAETVTGKWDLPRCNPHREFSASGFIDEFLSDEK